MLPRRARSTARAWPWASSCRRLWRAPGAPQLVAAVAAAAAAAAAARPAEVAACAPTPRGHCRCLGDCAGCWCR
eukprot:6547259-Alexandrium_andersonii.AAC.1